MSPHSLIPCISYERNCVCSNWGYVSGACVREYKCIDCIVKTHVEVWDLLSEQILLSVMLLLSSLFSNITLKVIVQKNNNHNLQ